MKMYRMYENLPAIAEPVTGIVTGAIPPWIKGSLYRNGPAMYEIGGERFSHLFDGMACIQKFQIENGSATYMRKYINSKTFKMNTSVNKIVVSEFGTSAKYPDPCKTIFARFLAYFKPELTDNTVVNIWPMGDRLYASTEANVMHEIDPENLDTKNSVNLSAHLTVDSATAHWHEDGDGSKHNIGYSYWSGTNYCLFKVPSSQDSEMTFKDSKMVARIPSKWRMHPGYYHSFAMTENYYVFLEQSLKWNAYKLVVSTITKSSFAECLDFWPKEKTVFHIVDKRTGERVNKEYTYQTDALFCFHHGNAYEHKGQIVLDICKYKDDTIIRKYYMKYWEKDSFHDIKDEIPPAWYTRYILPLDINQLTDHNENLVDYSLSKCTAELSSSGTITCTGERLYGQAFEFPQINYDKFNGKLYRYVFGMSYRDDGKYYVIKLDVETKETKEWTEDHVFCTEPIFVPNPDGQTEDDGAVLVVVNSIEEDRQAFLLVLDGQTFQETARVTFSDVKYFVRDFHGSFMTKT